MGAVLKKNVWIHDKSKDCIRNWLGFAINETDSLCFFSAEKWLLPEWATVRTFQKHEIMKKKKKRKEFPALKWFCLIGSDPKFTETCEKISTSSVGFGTISEIEMLI